MKTAELLVKCLENEGIQRIFGLPGEEVMEILDALHDSSIPFVTTRHEQGAAFMADVHGRLTGQAGVCLSTLGPGATNLITGVADANMDRAPLVAITGQAGLQRMHKESHQYLDLVSLFHPVTKWNTQVKIPGSLTEIVRKAFKVAQTEKTGACHIDLPEDVAKEVAEGVPLKVQQPISPEPQDRQIERAVKILQESKFPIILSGNGTLRARASSALRHFADTLNIPVAETFMGKGALPYNDPHSLMEVGLQARDYVSCGFDRADVVVCVGYDLVEYAPKYWNPHRDKKIIHIDLSPAEVDAHYIVEVGVVGEISLSLQALAQKVTPRQADLYRSLHDTIVHQIDAFVEDSNFPLKPEKVLFDLRHAMAPQDILISDVGAHKLWVARMFPCLEPNTCLISNGFASMGIALPGGIAAKLARPEVHVVTVSGDGGFLMNVQELETACRLGVPTVNLIFNDGGYGLIRWKQRLQFGRSSYIQFGNPDFVRLAESFGARGYRVQSAKELAPILEEALSLNVPSVIDCPVDFEENLRLTERLGHIVCPL
ncbi:MAG: acetolactate synthase large subunit [Nitrospirae bacterium]|nr:acetolactate synthase large subunit [Nitrospirota bacterium]